MISRIGRSWACWLLLGVAGCSGLVEDVDPSRLPKAEPQLVVHCYLSPQDTTVSVVVSESRTSVGQQQDSNQFNAIPTAKVTISESNQTVDLHYDSTLALYLSKPNQLSIKPNQSYSLKVQLADGRQINGTTRVPSSSPTPTLLLDSVMTTNSDSLYDYFVQLSWLDQPGQLNYYQVAGENEYGSIELVSQPGKPFLEVPFRAINEIFFQPYNESPFIIDDQKDGQRLSSARGKLTFTTINGKLIRNPPIWVQVYLLNVNLDYYQYHVKVLEQTRVNNNPFAEPIPVEGNLKGGFGCFAAYTKNMLRIRAK